MLKFIIVSEIFKIQLDQYKIKGQIGNQKQKLKSLDILQANINNTENLDDDVLKKIILRKFDKLSSIKDNENVALFTI